MYVQSEAYPWTPLCFPLLVNIFHPSKYGEITPLQMHNRSKCRLAMSYSALEGISWGLDTEVIQTLLFDQIPLHLAAADGQTLQVPHWQCLHHSIELPLDSLVRVAPRSRLLHRLQQPAAGTGCRLTCSICTPYQLSHALSCTSSLSIQFVAAFLSGSQPNTVSADLKSWFMQYTLPGA